MAILLIAALTAVRASGAEPAPPARSVIYPTRVMGTYANVIIVTSDSAAGAPAAALAHRELARIDSLMSNWTTTSEVARINRVAASGWTTVQHEVGTVVDTSLRVWRESDGTFDITVEPLIRAWGFLGGPRRVPSAAEAESAYRYVGAQRVHYRAEGRKIRFDEQGVRIDLGGIAKGYAVDCAAAVLVQAGVRDALVNLTGNMAAIGHPVGADHWRIGIRDPRDRMPFFARLDLHAGDGISTSGKYEQFVAQDGKTYGHIMDPRTGKPADGLISVTVVARSAFACDTWDTPLFVLGADAGKRKARERDDIDVVLVEPGTGGVDTVWVEASLMERFALEPAARALFVVRTY